jgi:murein DD-endopeptidase MepM/ murein hydrolase activator NlpD
MPRSFDEHSIYVVKSGDTLSGIAADNDVSLDALIAANAGIINDPGMIQVGWELVIPGVLTGNRRETPPSGDGVTMYTIQDGDTLGALADRWGTTVAAIVQLNGIPNPALIFVGQRLRKPGSAGAADATEPRPVVMAAQSQPLVSPGELAFVRWPLDMPSACITGGYRQDYGGYLHRGVDLGGVAVGTPIFAPAGGTLAVHRPGDGWGDGSFGNCVVIDHPGTPWWSIYAHMSETDRTTGETVSPGEVIGAVGFTGKVVPAGPAGAHTHWQLSNHPGFPPGFEYIANPLDFLRLA